MNAKENYFEAIRFGKPERVPLLNEKISLDIAFEGLCRYADSRDSWGIYWEVPLADTAPFPTEHPLPDLDRLADYRFPDPDALVFSDESRAALARVDHAVTLVSGSLPYFMFERACPLMGMEDFMISLLTHPSESHALLHGIARYNRRVFERYLELGVDMVSFSEDLGTQRALMMSPHIFREFFLPEYRYCFAPVLAAGKVVNFHSCGCIQEIAADLAEIGVTVLNPVQAWANDLPRVKQATAGKMALAGGIATALLAAGTPAQVRAETARVMEILKPGGGYVCGPDQGIPGIPEENMAALWDTATALGWY